MCLHTCAHASVLFLYVYMLVYGGVHTYTSLFYLCMSLHACILYNFKLSICVFLSMCVSGAWVVTHSDCEPRPLAGKAVGLAGLSRASKAALQLSLLSSAPLVVAGPSPCHSEEVFKRTPYWEASSVKTGQCHNVLLLAVMFIAPQ